MKKLLIISTAILMALPFYSQESPKPDTLWKFSGTAALNLSQLSLTNWAAGGDNSISGNALLNLSADYSNGNLNWDNDAILGYGMIRQGNTPSRKSDDKLDLSSKFGYKAFTNWYYSALLSFKSQFANGYDNPGEAVRTKISSFLSPGYLNLSMGLDYKPNEKFTALIAPLAGKVTLVFDDYLSSLGSYGLEPDQKIRAEFGGYVKLSYEEEIMKNVLLKTKIDFFSNYLENPQYVDVNWDLLLKFTINEYLSATLVTQLLYDRDILFEPEDGSGDPEPRIQFKELFGIGLSYSF